MPKREGISQGRFGDCFLIATLGTLAHNDPARLKKRFSPEPGGMVMNRPWRGCVAKRLAGEHTFEMFPLCE